MLFDQIRFWVANELGRSDIPCLAAATMTHDSFTHSISLPFVPPISISSHPYPIFDHESTFPDIIGDGTEILF